MDAISMIKGRRSVRKFKDEIVDRNTMKEIVDVARWAPSWGNFQVSRYTLVENQEMIKRLGEEGVNGFAYNVGTLKNAKNVAILSFVEGKSGKLGESEYATNKKNTWEVFDSGIACQTFCLAAHEKGIGTVIMGVIDDKAISKIVGLPNEETVSTIIVYGYPDETPAPSIRKDVSDIMRFIGEQL